MEVQDIKTLQDQVEDILKSDPATRNSDKALTIALWEKFYPQFIMPNERGAVIRIERIMDLPSQDGIKRVRAHLQNDLKKYAPTDWKVAKERGWYEEAWKEALGYPGRQKTFDFVAKVA